MSACTPSETLFLINGGRTWRRGAAGRDETEMARRGQERNAGRRRRRRRRGRSRAALEELSGIGMAVFTGKTKASILRP